MTRKSVTQGSMFLVTALLVGALAACGDDKPADNKSADGAQGKADKPAAAATFDKLPRPDFNRRAAELALPVFWRVDANGNNALDPDELTTIWGLSGGGKRSDFVDANGFTAKFQAAYQVMQAPADLSKLPAEQQKRLRAVLDELAQGRATLIETDLEGASAEDKAVVEHVLAAATAIERIYQKQMGVADLEARIPADDTASRALFYRNQGVACEAPKTEKDPDCNGLEAKPKKVSGLYPAALQSGTDTKFCEVLEKRKDADKLMHQFFVVQAKAGGRAAGNPATGNPATGNPATDELEAVPYTVAYQAEMAEVAAQLKQAAGAIVDPKEAAMKAYLLAAADSFGSNDWQPADEAWSKMNAENSKWYLRIGPDEVYSEPCSRKAMFHVSFARINKDSLEWQKKLEPHKADMEKALEKLAGAPYKARNVSFHLPDFIDIVLNAGDSRNALGATIGQSLPNWGPVANEGRGRTVAMVNLYTDKDSEAAWQAQVSSLFCKATMAGANPDNKLAVMSTVLHEAAHNLGPAHEYKVGGKTDDQIFGGPLASMLEELKAQTSALYFADWLVQKGVVDQKAADSAHLRDVTWAFGHISQGMYDAENKPKPYSQLASVQMGTLFKNEVLVWKADETAANGTDKGCFEVDLQKWKPVVEKLAARVLHTKGAGDKKEAEAIKAELVDAKDDWAAARETIRDRWLRAPKASFVYSIKN